MNQLETPTTRNVNPAKVCVKHDNEKAFDHSPELKLVKRKQIKSRLVGGIQLKVTSS